MPEGAPSPDDLGLSQREYDVVSLFGEGTSRKQISTTLGISETDADMAITTAKTVLQYHIRAEGLGAGEEEGEAEAKITDAKLMAWAYKNILHPDME